MILACRAPIKGEKTTLMDKPNRSTSRTNRPGKKIFAMLAILPLILFLSALNQWFPNLGDFAKVGGIPFSIFAVLVLLTSQVILAWLYLRLYESEVDVSQ